MLGIIGRKIGMTQVFDDKGNAVPVTLLEGGPCVITQIKDDQNYQNESDLEGQVPSRLHVEPLQLDIPGLKYPQLQKKQTFR